MNKEMLEIFLGYMTGIFVVGSILISMYMISDTRKTMQGYLECPVEMTTTPRNLPKITYVWAKDCNLVVQAIK